MESARAITFETQLRQPYFLLHVIKYIMECGSRDYEDEIAHITSRNYEDRKYHDFSGADDLNLSQQSYTD